VSADAVGAGVAEAVGNGADVDAGGEELGGHEVADVVDADARDERGMRTRF